MAEPQAHPERGSALDEIVGETGVRAGNAAFTPWHAIRRARTLRRSPRTGRDIHVDRNVRLLRHPERVELGNRVMLKEGVRLCPTNPTARVVIGDWTTVGYHTFIFAMTAIEIGPNCLLAPFCYLVDNEHGTRAGRLIREQPMTASPIRLGEGVWLGTGAVVTKGVQIGSGAVVGARSVVTADVPPDAIAIGVPATCDRLSGQVVKVVAVVLARLDSSRLPGKPLRPIQNRPMIEYVVEACSFDEADEVVVATTDRTLDDPLVEWAKGAGVDVFRGSDTDVAGRFLGALQAAGAAAGLRVNGDSPMHRRAMLVEGVRHWRARQPDLVTNVPGRTWPRGLSVEVVSTEAMTRARERMTAPDHREHVTSYFYDNPDGFTIEVLPNGPSGVGGAPLAVDEDRDLRRFSHILSVLGPRFRCATVDELVVEAAAFDEGSG